MTLSAEDYTIILYSHSNRFFIAKVFQLTGKFYNCHVYISEQCSSIYINWIIKYSPVVPNIKEKKTFSHHVTITPILIVVKEIKLQDVYTRQTWRYFKCSTATILKNWHCHTIVARKFLLFDSKLTKFHQNHKHRRSFHLDDPIHYNLLDLDIDGNSWYTTLHSSIQIGTQPLLMYTKHKLIITQRQYLLRNYSSTQAFYA